MGRQLVWSSWRWATKRFQISPSTGSCCCFPVNQRRRDMETTTHTISTGWNGCGSRGLMWLHISHKCITNDILKYSREVWSCHLSLLMLFCGILNTDGYNTVNYYYLASHLLFQNGHTDIFHLLCVLLYFTFRALKGQFNPKSKILIFHLTCRAAYPSR